MATNTLMTAEDFLRSGSETDRFELVRGELAPMPPPGDKHGLVCMNIGHILNSYVDRIGYGFVLGNDAGIITRKSPDTVRGVDVSLFLRPEWADGRAPEGYTDVPPDLAVEVRSPGQSWSEVTAKVAEYLAMGVKMVWVADPKTRRVTVFTPEEEPVVHAAESEWDGGQVLPGLQCSGARVFRGV